MSILEKTFAQVLIEFNTYPHKVKAFLADNRLSAAEKNILQAHLNIRDNKNEEVISALLHLSSGTSNFIEAQRLMILGSAFNNLTKFDDAKTNLEKAIALFEKCNATYFVFHASFTLFWIFANLEDIKSMKIEFDRMGSINPQDGKQALKFLRSKFCFFQLSGLEIEAKDVLMKIDQHFFSMNEDDKTRHLIDKFIFFIQINDLLGAKEILESSKKFRKFSLSENYNYMKKMLDHLILNTPLYAYEKDFKGTPMLFDQIKCIQMLEENNIEGAREIWGRLSKSSPELYKEFLVYNGKRSLFSLCLEKHHPQQSFFRLDPQKEYPSKLDALVDHLFKANGPIRAAHLFELVWGEPAEAKEDLIKVSRLVYRAKVDRKIDIEYRKGTYTLKKGSISKVSSF